jgi:hypothetical protein
MENLSSTNQWQHVCTQVGSVLTLATHTEKYTHFNVLLVRCATLCLALQCRSSSSADAQAMPAAKNADSCEVLSTGWASSTAVNHFKACTPLAAHTYKRTHNPPFTDHSVQLWLSTGAIAV